MNNVIVPLSLVKRYLTDGQVICLMILANTLKMGVRNAEGASQTVTPWVQGVWPEVASFTFLRNGDAMLGFNDDTAMVKWKLANA